MKTQAMTNRSPTYSGSDVKVKPTVKILVATLDKSQSYMEHIAENLSVTRSVLS